MSQGWQRGRRGVAGVSCFVFTKIATKIFKKLLKKGQFDAPIIRIEEWFVLSFINNKGSQNNNKCNLICVIKEYVSRTEHIDIVVIGMI